MSFKQVISPYVASFRLGAHLAMTERSDFISMIATYTVLVLIFASVYAIMPVKELGRADITQDHLLWYFAITEIVVVCSLGNRRELGRQIGDGNLTILIQRPGSMTGLLLARLIGNSFVNMAALGLYAVLLLSGLLHIPCPLSIVCLPLLFISILAGISLYLSMDHMIGMLEIFGPYSQPSAMILGKLVFTLGGLFFPVIFYPDTLQSIVWLTPFPAVITTPGSFMLNPTTTQIAQHIAHQIIWLTLIISLMGLLEQRLIKRVLVTGD